MHLLVNPSTLTWSVTPCRQASRAALRPAPRALWGLQKLNWLAAKATCSACVRAAVVPPRQAASDGDDWEIRAVIFGSLFEKVSSLTVGLWHSRSPSRHCGSSSVAAAQRLPAEDLTTVTSVPTVTATSKTVQLSSQETLAVCLLSN